MSLFGDVGQCVRLDSIFIVNLNLAAALILYVFKDWLLCGRDVYHVVGDIVLKWYECACFPHFQSFPTTVLL